MRDSHPTYTAKRPAAAWVWAVSVLACGLPAFLATDRWFSILEDETSIVTFARRPVVETLAVFWSGVGQHEHPPLSDLLLHFWIPIGGTAQWSLRFPSVLFYLGGLLVLAHAAAKIGKAPAFRALLAIGVLWPFAFHFGRLTGWYSFCFFLVTGATWAYVHYMDSPGRTTFGVFVAACLMLVYSNYYGWPVVGCFAIDAFFVRRRKHGIRLLLSTLVILVIAYTPLWVVFGRKIVETASVRSGSWVSRIFNGAYNFYSLFVSESVAPWFWYFSIPALVCIALSLFLAWVLLPREHRRFLIYFLLLFVGLAALDINTKRLLFMSPWLLLSLALALSAARDRRTRRLLVLSLASISAIGWLGTAARTTYAAAHFIEPWAEIADQAALSVKDGSLIVSNSPSFLFDVNYSLERLHLISSSSVPGWVSSPSVIPIDQWTAAAGVNRPSVVFVKGTNRDAVETTKAADEWLGLHCLLTGEEKHVRDSGYDLKARFFKNARQDPFRIIIKRFDCSMSNGVPGEP